MVTSVFIFTVYTYNCTQLQAVILLVVHMEACVRDVVQLECLIFENKKKIRANTFFLYIKCILYT